MSRLPTWKAEFTADDISFIDGPVVIADGAPERGISIINLYPTFIVSVSSNQANRIGIGRNIYEKTRTPRKWIQVCKKTNIVKCKCKMQAKLITVSH